MGVEVLRPGHGGTPVRADDQDPGVHQKGSMTMVHLGPTSTTKTYRPRVGDIGLVRISGAGGRIIRSLQWADGCGYEDYEHALGVVENDPAGDTGPVIVEAEPGGAVKVPLHYTGVRWLVCP